MKKKNSQNGPERECIERLASRLGSIGIVVSQRPTGVSDVITTEPQGVLFPFPVDGDHDETGK